MHKRTLARVHYTQRGKARVDAVAVSADLDENLSWLKKYLGYKETFDLIAREFKIGQKRAGLIYIDSFVSQTDLTLIMERFLQAPESAMAEASLTELLNRRIPYIELTTETELSKTAEQILSGPCALLVDGVSHAVIMDVRKYPDREPSEPSLERVLRGPHDGFVETMIFNTIMIRRRLRDPNLRVEIHEAGRRSKADIALIFIKDIANEHLVGDVRRRIKAIDVDVLTMSEKALQEWIVRKPWWNPFPVIRFTERPDVAAEHLSEGHVLVIIDTSPNAIILPVTLFSFLQSVEEYHEDVLIGSYLKWVRFVGMLFSWLGPPLWYAMLASHTRLGSGWNILVSPQIRQIPIFWQLTAAEVGVDLLRLALIFAPNPLGQSMGFFGAVLMGSVAVKAKLLDAEVMIYVVVAAVGTFSAPDIDFGMAIRVLRAFLLIATGVGAIFSLPWTGFCLGVLIPLAILANTRSLGVSYLWPLWPWSASFFGAGLIRKPLNVKVMRPPVTLPQDPTHRRPPEPGS